MDLDFFLRHVYPKLVKSHNAKGEKQQVSAESATCLRQWHLTPGGREEKREPTNMYTRADSQHSDQLVITMLDRTNLTPGFQSVVLHMSRLMTKPTKWLCAQRRQISLGIRPVWSESSLCAQWVAKDPSIFHADSEASDQTGRSLRWAHMPFCWFCHVAAQL